MDNPTRIDRPAPPRTAAILAAHHCRFEDLPSSCGCGTAFAAAALWMDHVATLLAAELWHRNITVVHTVAELNALPETTVILARPGHDNRVCILKPETKWFDITGARLRLESAMLPALVLERGPAPADREQECLAG